MTMPYDAIVAGLVQQGVPRAKAERAALQQLQRPTISGPAVPEIVLPRATIVWPVRLRLPWSYLVADNEKYGVINGRMLLTTRYRQAKAAIAAKARELVGDVEPAATPLRLEAAVYVPDRRPHDVANFAKCVHDALEKTVYASDRWLDDVRWYRAGVDVDAPRAELTITPLEH